MIKFSFEIADDMNYREYYCCCNYDHDRLGEQCYEQSQQKDDVYDQHHLVE